MRLPNGVMEALERSREKHPDSPAFGCCGHRVILPSGAKSRWVNDPNDETIEGLQYLLQVGYMGAGQLAQIFPWFGRLVASGGFVAFAAADTHAQIDGTNQWAEEIQYTVGGVAEGATWVLVAPTGAELFISNVASPMAFLATANIAVKGSFLASTKTFGAGAGQRINSESFFSQGDRSVQSGSTLEVDWTFSLAIG